MEWGKQIKSIAERFDLAALYVFGSQARAIAARVAQEDLSCQGTLNAASDVDVGVLPAKGGILSAEAKVLLTMELEELFGVLRVDLLAIPEADSFLAVNIIRGERLFCQDQDRGDEYELYLLRRAGDLAPLERERIALILGESVRLVSRGRANDSREN
ncbi:MAG: nucleotidyltransferase domain-containing protein [Candidatus Tectomicrobia bacterium]|uniref:Nucleotidyltransferase domain-containing protein n=1 Tax=Tectimicrobiota bacterium TaxID=2528274 RepID=A0A933GPC4_UNCTE|nr:nucleotidyltransferase domain-containing protein [Candidatus Tectomicrobia bacterium]